MKIIANTKSIFRKFANRLTGLSSRLRSSTKKRILVAAILLATAQCFFMMLAPFGNSHNRTKDFPVDEISSVLLPDPEKNLTVLDTSTLRELKSAMDSLGIYDAETFWRRMRRKGLLDSAASFIFHK